MCVICIDATLDIGEIKTILYRCKWIFTDFCCSENCLIIFHNIQNTEFLLTRFCLAMNIYITMNLITVRILNLHWNNVFLNKKGIIWSNLVRDGCRYTYLLFSESNVSSHIHHINLHKQINMKCYATVRWTEQKPMNLLCFQAQTVKIKTQRTLQITVLCKQVCMFAMKELSRIHAYG